MQERTKQEELAYQQGVTDGFLRGAEKLMETEIPMSKNEPKFVRYDIEWVKSVLAKAIRDEAGGEQ